MPSLLMQSVGVDVLWQVSHIISGSIEKNNPDTETRESFCVAVLGMVSCATERFSHPAFLKVLVFAHVLLEEGKQRSTG